MFLTDALAQSALHDPAIPDGEKITYSLAVGSEKSTVTEETFQKEETGRKYYEITMKSDSLDMTTKLDRETMYPLSSVVLQREKGVVIERQARLIKNDTRDKEGEISVMDYNSLVYFLRGFPFDKQKKNVSIKMLASKGSFSMFIKNDGRENVTINGKKFDCYKLELGVSGVMGALFPKSGMWYYAQAPHYLVRFEGMSGGAGSPKRIQELVSYNAGGKN